MPGLPQRQTTRESKSAHRICGDAASPGRDGVACADTSWGIGIGLLGLLVLILALVTGNAKFWG
jgi:hypothetical protein